MRKKDTTQNGDSGLQRRTYETSYVQSLFDSIAQRYDFLTHVLSFGIDTLWRKRAIRLLAPYRPKHILDVATGTADLAIEASKLHPEAITGIDVSQRMMDVGIKKIMRRNLSDIMTIQSENAEAMTFASDSFDAVTVSFGVRNFSNLQKGLSEFHRVLRNGGVAMILEFSHPQIFPIKQLYRFYSTIIMPPLGEAILHDRSASDYLPSTISEFPSGETFCALLRSVGFTQVKYFPLTFGIATIYFAEKHSCLC
ncbi:MAG TPA: bifunctional demethylmenaquinone methyltransferase/2-methoxy-6-polyprenyl-1,4-benzoquinol methylase UbiE [Bacteroidota bacterium]|nr:bifunctional demethylmenaquinone methyltransferase/2-methoxy-6-polyprenyl-1,4-benzoquinol methylase UbiE [Bacteroidota bacterium]